MSSFVASCAVASNAVVFFDWAVTLYLPFQFGMKAGPKCLNHVKNLEGFPHPVFKIAAF